MREGWFGRIISPVSLAGRGGEGGCEKLFCLLLNSFRRSGVTLAYSRRVNKSWLSRSRDKEGRRGAVVRRLRVQLGPVKVIDHY